MIQYTFDFYKLTRKYVVKVIVLRENETLTKHVKMYMTTLIIFIILVLVFPWIVLSVLNHFFAVPDFVILPVFVIWFFVLVTKEIVYAPFRIAFGATVCALEKILDKILGVDTLYIISVFDKVEKISLPKNTNVEIKKISDDIYIIALDCDLSFA